MISSDRGGKPALSRRAFVGKLAAGAAIASAVSLTVGEAQALSRRPKAPTGAGNRNDQGAPTPQAAGANPAVDARVIQAQPVEMPAASAAAPPVSAPPWELLRPLAVGSVVAHGWRVAELSGVADGSLVLTLENERGRAHRIHLCRNDGHPQGLVYTKRVDMVVMNGGQGDQPTEEGLAQAVAEVAHVLAANESDRHVAALLPHAERVRRFAAAAALR